jgi:UDP-N-acetylglucosamine--N-acetylmuramyl-(pentapeptide) pyrophosphoryl-undecaprenol N-acetylglucosamine transferase
MKIILAGGGTGGHVTPLIAIASELRLLEKEKHLPYTQIYFLADRIFDEVAWRELDVVFKSVFSAKLPIGSSFLIKAKNAILMVLGIIKTFFIMLSIYPDVVVSKGGHSAFPTVICAWILRIPIVMHESDMFPGRVNQITAKLASRIAVSFPQVIDILGHPEISIHSGQPIRESIKYPIADGAHEYLGLESKVPIIWIFAGSQGAQKINNTILDSLLELVPNYQLIHQVGSANEAEVAMISQLLLKDSLFSKRHHIVGFLDPLAISMCAGVADIVIGRGSSSIFEFANWKLPSIIIPITHSNGDHQRKNAYAYAGSGACTVIEESNLSPHLLMSEIRAILENKQRVEAMKIAAGNFAPKDAAKIIAQEVIEIALSHEN